MKHGRDLRALAASSGLDLDTASAERLEAFATLLGDRAVPLGLVAASDAGRVRERHVVDCLRAAAAVRDGDLAAYDIGAGAGLPGIVVAVARPALHVTLVEPRRTRVAFLELAVDTLGLRNADVLASRIEDVSGVADVCFARAFAPAAEAWSAAERLLRDGGRLVYFAGAATAGDVPIGPSSIEVVDSPVLESSGPLIIMSR